VRTPITRRVADLAQATVAPERLRRVAAGHRRVVRIAVPALAVSALGAGLAFSLPQQAVTTAVPATSTPFGRVTDESVSRSTTRPALTAGPSADAGAAAAKAADLKAAAARKAKADAKAVAARKAKADAAAKKAAAAKAAEKAAEPKKTGSAGSRYAEVTLNLRSSPKDSARTSTDVAAGAKVSVTGYTLDSWAQVTTRSRTGWVKKSYLATDKPKVAASSGSSAGVAGGACASSAVENGLTPDAVKVHRAICHAFPAVKSYGGVRADSLPEHPSGRALDAMISSSSQGQQIADWVRAHASELGVSQVIYAQRIWTVQRSGEGWRSMSDRGSATANHFDHVHVTVYGNSAK
jgi:hypothetical protein